MPTTFALYRAAQSGAKDNTRALRLPAFTLKTQSCRTLRIEARTREDKRELLILGARLLRKRQSAIQKAPRHRYFISTAFPAKSLASSQL